MKYKSLLARRSLRFVAAGACLTALISTSALASQLDKAALAVTVSGPVEVQGSVEVLNDALRIPYNKLISQPLPNGSAFAGYNFPAIPAGKRLVIETMAVIIAVPAGQSGYAEFSVNGQGPNGQAFGLPLSVSPQGTYGGESRFIGTHKVKIIIDPRVSFGLHISVSRTSNVGVGWYNVALNGYLEDLPALSP